MDSKTLPKDYKSYDYKQLTVKETELSFCIDCYENFGWVLDENKPPHTERGQSRIFFKRDRKFVNKAELTRLERNFDACLAELNEMERSKTSVPTVWALSCALAGTVLLAGSVFAVTAEPPIVWLCALLGVPGVLGWILPYFIYRQGAARQVKKVTPFIEAKYDEIEAICAKGYSLLRE